MINLPGGREKLHSATLWLPTTEGGHVIKGLRDFLLRGNVVDLAVAVVVGVAFGAVVTAFATDFIGRLIGAIGGTPDFGDAGFTVNDSKIIIGSTINALIYFLIVATSVYFFVVVPMNKLMEMRKRGEVPEVAAPSEDIVLLQEIRDLLRERQV
jgi:large conductance mechanosensitive channel